MNHLKLILTFLFLLLSISSANVMNVAGRSRSSLMKVVKKELKHLTEAYHNRLKDNSDLWGKITIKFGIDEFGNVLFSKVVSSTVKDSLLENTCDSIVATWKFEKINKPGDITEVVYPFVFTTGQSMEDVKALDLRQTLMGPRTASSIVKIFSFNKNKLIKLYCETTSTKPSKLISTELSINYLGFITDIIIDNEKKHDSTFISEFQETLKTIDFMRKYGSMANTTFKYTFNFSSYISECSKNSENQIELNNSRSNNEQ